MSTRIAIAGDWHATSWWARDCINSLPEDVRLLVHLGDFGLMGPTRDSYISTVSEVAARKGVDLWVIPGNHEDYDWLDAQLVDEEGVATIAENILILPRGYRFVIERVVFCTVGGAVSHDQAQRVTGQSWWPQEEISEAQVAAVCADGRADILLTHDAPTKAAPPNRSHDDLVQYAGVEVASKVLDHASRIQTICDALSPRRLLHGHFHARYTNEFTGRDRSDASYECQVDGLACDKLAGNIVLMTVNGGTESIEEFEVNHDH